MKSLYTSIIISIISIFSLYSQDNFSKGYYLTNEGDSISGYIKYQPYYHYRKDFKFKKDKNSELIDISVKDDINLFYIKSSNQFYIREIVTIHLKPDFNTEIATDNYIVDTVFVKLLVEGTISLFEYRDLNMRQNFYMSKDSSGLQELFIKQYYHEILDDGNPVKELITDEIYTDVLRDNLRDCDVVWDEIYKAELTEKSLVRLVTMYNNCSSISSGSDYIVDLDPEYKIRYTVFSGIGNSHWNFHGSKEVFNNFNNNSNYFYSVGAEVSFLFPKVNDRIAFGTGVTLQKNKFINTVELDYAVFMEVQEANIRTRFAHVPFFMKYYFPGESVDFNISGGVFMSFLFSTINELKITRIFEDGTTDVKQEYAIGRVKNYEYISALKDYEAGLFVGIGVDYKLATDNIISLDLKAYKGGSISSTSTVVTESYTYALLAGYSF